MNDDEGGGAGAGDGGGGGSRGTFRLSVAAGCPLIPAVWLRAINEQAVSGGFPRHMSASELDALLDMWTTQQLHAVYFPVRMWVRIYIPYDIVRVGFWVPDYSIVIDMYERMFNRLPVSSS